MSTSKLRDWLDTIDSYGMQRVIFHKALFIATMLVFGYWILQPPNLLAYIAPIFVMRLDEIPGTHVRQREKRMYFIFAMVLLCSMSFYVLFPFKFIFLFYSIIIFTLIYIATLYFYPELKTSITLIFMDGILFVSAGSDADLQTAYNIFSSMVLSMIIIFTCIKIFPGYYQFIWRRATILLLTRLAQQMDDTLHNRLTSYFYEEVTHLNVMRCYCKLLPLAQLRHALKITHQVRKVQFITSTLHYDKINQPFWHETILCLRHIKHAMQTNHVCSITHIMSYPVQTKLQQAAMQYITSIIHHWNSLCALRKNA